MTTQVLNFVTLPDKARKKVRKLPRVTKHDRVEFRILRRRGSPESMSIPSEAVDVFYAVLEHLANGERVAVLTEDKELSPNEAATILGISRPLVVHRMDLGDLPFRYVGKHRRAKLKDVLELKSRIDTQRQALRELAEVSSDWK